MKEQLWSEVPKKVQKQMLKEQVKQGNKKDPFTFKKNLIASRIQGGFDWWATAEGDLAWEQAMFDRNYELLYKQNPKLKP